MSAERDQTQKFKFVYSNLYHVYQKGKEAARSAPDFSSAIHSVSLKENQKSVGQQHFQNPEMLSGKILKADAVVQPLARPYQGKDFSAEKRINSARIHEMRSQSPDQQDPVASLRSNLSELDNLQNRLRFMLKELEELTKNSKS